MDKKRLFLVLFLILGLLACRGAGALPTQSPVITPTQPETGGSVQMNTPEARPTPASETEKSDQPAAETPLAAQESLVPLVIDWSRPFAGPTFTGETIDLKR